MVFFLSFLAFFCMFFWLVCPSASCRFFIFIFTFIIFGIFPVFFLSVLVFTFGQSFLFSYKFVWLVMALTSMGVQRSLGDTKWNSIRDYNKISHAKRKFEDHRARGEAGERERETVRAGAGRSHQKAKSIDTNCANSSIRRLNPFPFQILRLADDQQLDYEQGHWQGQGQGQGRSCWPEGIASCRS